MSNRKFIRAFIIAFFTCMLLLVAGNYVIDPYGFHFHNRYEGFNKHKPSFLQYTRLIKLYNADAVDPNTLFLGNSRILYLMPEEAFKEFIPGRYYNWALSGGTPSEMDKLLEYSIRNFDIKHVVYGVDLITFSNWKAKYGHPFDTALVAGDKSMIIEFLKLHTSTQAVQEAFWCVDKNLDDPEGYYLKYHYNKSGSRTNKWREINAERLGDGWMDEQFQQVMDVYRPIYNNPNLKMPYYSKQAYRLIYNNCLDHNITYTAYVNPLYADQFKMLLQSKSYPVYLEFLRFLALNGGFWYFGGINEITSNKNYYWDSQHPRKSLGTFISNPMFLDKKPIYVNSLFGTFYDESNLDILISDLDSLKNKILIEEE